jgi:hypothetical protein
MLPIEFKVDAILIGITPVPFASLNQPKRRTC